MIQTTEPPSIHQMKRSTLLLFLVVSQNKQTKKMEQGKNVDAHSINSLFEQKLTFLCGKILESRVIR